MNRIHPQYSSMRNYEVFCILLHHLQLHLRRLRHPSSSSASSTIRQEPESPRHPNRQAGHITLVKLPISAHLTIIISSKPRLDKYIIHHPHLPPLQVHLQFKDGSSLLRTAGSTFHHLNRISLMGVIQEFHPHPHRHSLKKRHIKLIPPLTPIHPLHTTKRTCLPPHTIILLVRITTSNRIKNR